MFALITVSDFPLTTSFSGYFGWGLGVAQVPSWIWAGWGSLMRLDTVMVTFSSPLPISVIVARPFSPDSLSAFIVMVVILSAAWVAPRGPAITASTAARTNSPIFFITLNLLLVGHHCGITRCDNSVALTPIMRSAGP